MKQTPPHVGTTTAAKRVGDRGEEIACRYLQSLPYEIKATNLKVGKHDEIDILAYDPEDDVLVFVEVKTRTKNDEDYHPYINLTARKRNALWRAARRWVMEHEYDDGFRIDLLCIANGQIVDHFKEIRKPKQPD